MQASEPAASDVQERYRLMTVQTPPARTVPVIAAASRN